MLTYTGFSVVAAGREYSFSLSKIDNPIRYFTVVIANAIFRPGLLKFQEGPEVCYGKLAAALVDEPSAAPVSDRLFVTEAEASQYQSAGRSKSRVWTDEQRLEAKRRFKARALRAGR